MYVLFSHLIPSLVFNLVPVAMSKLRSSFTMVNDQTVVAHVTLFCFAPVYVAGKTVFSKSDKEK